MGMLIEGNWHEVDRAAHGGAFVRQESGFRNWVTASGASGFPARPDRYHLYVSLACPWASRAVVVRALKRLERVIGLTVVSPDMMEHGWTFEGGSDLLTGFEHLHQLYTLSDPSYTGHVTVPVLWDRERRMIVNNESSEIIRMMNREFDAWGDGTVDLYPPHLSEVIDALNAEIYESINNGVYRAGFATTQEAYNDAVGTLFPALDQLEALLATHRFLFGPNLTESDVRLFTTLIRFDTVYYGHFKCNLRQIRDYPNLYGWLRDVYQWPGIAGTVSLNQIKRHYYGSQRWVNPTGIVPLGPIVDFESPSNREHLT